LRADVLLAGFAGSIAALTFFNAVPTSGDTWRELVRTTLRRTWFCLASALTAGYITPLLLIVQGPQLQVPDAMLATVGFVAGGAIVRPLVVVAIGHDMQAGAVLLTDRVSLVDLCFTCGFAVLIVRSRFKEPKP